MSGTLGEEAPCPGPGDWETPYWREFRDRLAARDLAGAAGHLRRGIAGEFGALSTDDENWSLYHIAEVEWVSGLMAEEASARREHALLCIEAAESALTRKGTDYWPSKWCLSAALLTHDRGVVASAVARLRAWGPILPPLIPLLGEERACRFLYCGYLMRWTAALLVIGEISEAERLFLTVDRDYLRTERSGETFPAFLDLPNFGVEPTSRMREHAGLG